MKSSTKVVRYVVSIAGCSLSAFLTCTVYANPVIDNIAAGQISIQETPNTVTINQSSQQAILNWQSFNIGAHESTHFNQPLGGIALNRINPSQGASQIYGSLTATGQIILINPAGVYFGPSAYVNVGGLIATTANISDQNFMNKLYEFSKVNGYSGAVINEGQIIAAQNGLIALVAPGVINNGVIQANLGKVILASGEAFTLDFTGDNMINFAVTEATTSRGIDKDGHMLDAGISNTGSLLANGGTILLSAKSASGVLDHTINMEGIAQAKSIQQRNGEIIISGDTESADVRVAAKIDVSGKSTNETGGNVTITGHNILLDTQTHIDASGESGGGDIQIGGNYQGKGSLPNANAVVMMPDVTLIADAILSGNGGNIILWSDYVTKAYGKISTQGGSLSGNGGFIETSSKQFLDVGDIQISTLAPNGQTGQWLLDPSNITINNAATSGMNTGSSIYVPTTDSAVLSAAALGTALNTSNITIATTNGGGTQLGDITFADATGAMFTNWTTLGNTLTFQADNNIIVNNSISLRSGQALSLVAGNTTATGGITLNNNIRAGTVAGTGTVTMRAGTAGTITIAAALGTTLPFGTLTINSNGASTTAMNANVTTSGAQNYNTPVTLGGNVTLTTTNSAVNFASTLDRDATARTLTITAGTGAINFTGNVGAGGNGALGAMLVTNTGNTTLSGTLAAASFAKSAGGITFLNGGTITTAGTLTFNGAVTLGANTTLNTTNSAVLFASTLDRDVTAARTLAINAGSGAITLTGNVGAGVNGALGALTLNSTGVTTLTGLITAAAITTNTGGSTSIGAASINTSGDIVFNDTVTLTTAAKALTSTAGSITFGSIVSGAFGLTLNGNTGVTFNGIVGATVANLAVTGLTNINANITTTGTQTYNSGVILGANVTLTSTNSAINLASSIDRDATARTLSISSGTGAITLGGNIGAGVNGALGAITLTNTGTTTVNGTIAAASFVKSAGGTTLLNSGTITTTGIQTYGGAVTLGADTTLSTTNSAVLFSSTLDRDVTAARTLAINAGSGAITLTGNIGAGVNGTLGALTLNSTGVTTLTGAITAAAITTNTGGSTSIGSASINTSGDILFNDAVTLTTAAKVLTSTAGSITFGSTVNGAFGLTLNGNTGVTFNGVLGATVTSLSVTGATTINANITTTGNQTYNGVLTPGAATTTLTTTAASSNITINQPLNWASSNALSLVVNATSGTITLPSTVDAVNGGLTLTASNTANSINASSVSINNLLNFNLITGQWLQVATTLPIFNVTNFRTASGAGPNAATFFVRALSGNGTNLTPYQLTDRYGLQGIGSGTTALSYYYQLANDIDLASTSTWNTNTGWSPIGSNALRFTGNLDGQNYSINNIYINRASSSQGLFGYNAGTIQNLTISGGSLTFGTTSGVLVANNTATGVVTNIISRTTMSPIGSAGGVVGVNAGNISYATNYTDLNLSSGLGGIAAINSGTVSWSTNYGDIYISNQNTAGGIVGSNSGTVSTSVNYGNANLVNNASNTGGIVGVNTGTVTQSMNYGAIVGLASYGGIVGTNNGGTISNSINIGAMGPGGYSFGGIVGGNTSGSIINSYNIGYVTDTATQLSGGVVGTVTTATITSSFFNNELTGAIAGGGGTSANTAAMMAEATYSGWDFSTIWGINEGTSFPYLKAFYPTAPRVVTGTSNAQFAPITVAANGTVVGSTVTLLGGYVYFIGPAASLPDNSNILVYYTGGILGNSISQVPAGGAGINVTLAQNTVTLGNTSAQTLNYSNLATAKGGLTDPNILFSVSGNTITLGNATYPNTGFSTTATTTYDFNNPFIQLGTGDLTFNGPTALNLATVTSNGSQAYSGATTFYNDLTLDAGAYNITLGSLFNADIVGRNITLNAAGITTLNGNIGSLNRLNSITTNAAGSTVLNGLSLQTTNGMIFNDAVSLAVGDSTLTSTNNNINFYGGITGNNFSLTLNGNTGVNLTGNVTGITNLNVTGPTSINGNITVTNQTYNSDITLYNDATFSGVIFNSYGHIYTDNIARNLSISTNSSGILTYDLGTTTPFNNITLSGAGTKQLNLGAIQANGNISLSTVSANQNSVFRSVNGSLTISGITGGHDLSLQSATGITLGGTVSLNNLDVLGTVNLTSNVNTTGYQHYFNSVTATGRTLNSNNNNMTFDDLLNSASTLTLNPGTGTLNVAGNLSATTTLTLNLNGTANLNGTVSARTLTTAGSGTLHINGGTVTTTTGAQTYGTAVVIGANTTMNTTNTAVTFNSTLDRDSTARNLTINAGTAAITLAGNVGSGSNGALGNLLFNTSGVTTLTGTINTASLTTDLGGSTLLNSGNIQTSGNVLFNDAVTLGVTNKSITSTAGTITFNNTLNGAFGLTLNGNTGVTFNAAVGNTITNLDVSGPTFINVNITTAGPQVYRGATVLGTNLTLTSTNSDISIIGTVDNDATVRSLSINSGSGLINLAGNIGYGVNGALGAIQLNSSNITTLSGNVNASSITTDAVGSTAINTLSLNTTGAQTYNDAVILTGNSSLTTTNGTILFSGLVDRDSVARDITLNSTTGDIIFAGNVGSTNGALGNINLNTAGVKNINATITAESLTTSTTGSTSISGSTITTNGNLTLNDATSIITNNKILTSTNGSIIFNNDINGLYTLTLNSATGVIINNHIGGTGLTSLNITGPTIFNADVSTIANQTYNGVVTPGSSNASLTTTGNGGNITFSQPISWSTSNALTLNATGTGGNLTLPSSINAPLGSLILNATSTINAASTAVNVGTFNVLSGQWVQVNNTLPAFAVTNFMLNNGNGPTANVTFMRMLGGDGSGGNPYQITDAYGLQGIGSNTTTLASNYIVANDFVGSTTASWNNGLGFAPLNYSGGMFDGNNKSIDMLTINRPLENNIGLFASTSINSIIQTLSLTNLAISGGNNVGGLVGLNSGNITHVYTNGVVTGVSSVGGIIGAMQGANAAQNSALITSYSTASVNGSNNVGGLVGTAYTQIGDLGTNTIEESFSAGQINVVGAGNNIGGLVGYIQDPSSTITNVYSNIANITDSNNSTNIGGLVGLNNGNINNSYSMTSLTINPGTTNVGGLVGSNLHSIIDTYSTGIIRDRGATTVGGLIGLNSGSVTSSYWDTEVSRVNVSAAGTGLTTAQMQMQTSYNGWDFAATWNIAEGQSYPFLNSFYSTAPRIISGVANTLPDTSVTFATNGTVINTVYTGSNGSYYFLAGNNLVSGINSTIIDGAAILAYISNGGEVGNAVMLAPTNGGNIARFNIVADTITVGNSLTNTYNNTILAAAVGGLSNDNILYSANGNNIVIGNNSNPNVGLRTSATTSFTLNGNIISHPNATASSITFNNNVETAANVTLSASNLTFINGITGSDNLTLLGSGTNSSLNMNNMNIETFNITGTDAGTLTGLLNFSGAIDFNNIQNITGGANGNNFIFSGNASMAGIVNGRSLSNINTLDLSAYAQGISLYLSDTNDGRITNQNNINVAGFANIGRVDASSSRINTLYVPPGKSSYVYITSAKTGYINDPLYFSGFNNLVGTDGSTLEFASGATYSVLSRIYKINGTPMGVSNFGTILGATNIIELDFDVSNIIQEPIENSRQQSNSPIKKKPLWLTTVNAVKENLDMIVAKMKDTFHLSYLISNRADSRRTL